MTFITLKEAQKWFLENVKDEELRHFHNLSFISEKYQKSHPDEYVIDNNKIILDGQILDVDLNDKTLIFYSTRGSYSSYSRTRKCELTRITLNETIMKCAYHERMKIRVVMPDDTRYILKLEQIPQIMKRRVQITYGHRLYPMDLSELQLEPKDQIPKHNKKITDFELIH